jgi:hypothetical protein
MWRRLEGKTGIIIAFILGLALATGTTASAAMLITSKQIKNGTIKMKDLSPQVRAKIQAPGPAGVAGPQGAPGATGVAGPTGLTGPFRDYLRAHRQTARAYEKLKRELADRYRNDREAYTQGKTGFVQAVLARASSG